MKLFECFWLIERGCTRSPPDSSRRTWRWTSATPPVSNSRNESRTSQRPVPINFSAKAILYHSCYFLTGSLWWKFNWILFFLFIPFKYFVFSRKTRRFYKEINWVNFGFLLFIQISAGVTQVMCDRVLFVVSVFTFSLYSNCTSRKSLGFLLF